MPPETSYTKTETNVKELKINILSQEAFDTLSANGEVNQNEIYMTPGQKVPTKTSELENDAGYLTEHQDISGKLDKTGDASNTTASFTAASTRTNLTSGEKLSVSLGKIAKYFSDLKTIAFTGSYNDLSNKPSIPDAYSHPTFTSYTSGLYKIETTTEGHVTSAIPVTKEDITALGIPAQDTDTIYVHPTYNDQPFGLYRIKVTGGHVQSISAVTKEDITALGIPGQDTVYTHPAYTSKTIGLYKISVDSTGHVNSVSAITKDDITGLGIPAQDTVYTHPTNIDALSGLYKVTISNGHVTAVSAVTKSDITGLGIPAQDTTYSNATQTTNGLMSSSDKVKLDGIETGANKTVIDSSLSDTSTNPVQNKVVKAGLDAVNSRIDAITDGADKKLDTFKEISDYLANHQTEYEALAAISSNKVDKVDGKGLSTNDYTNEEKTKLYGIASGAEVNQNAFSSMNVNGTAIDSSSKTDTFSFVSGSNIELVPDKTNKKITIKANVPINVSDLNNDSGYLTEHQDISGKLDKTGDGSNVTSTFTTRTERTALSSGDSLSVLFGKIAKYFADLGSLSFKSTVQKSDLEPSVQTTLDSVVAMTDEEINAICV